MRNSLRLVFLLLFCYAVPAIAQDQSSSSSKSSPDRPAKQQRNTEAAKKAEVEGEDYLFQKHDVNRAIESFKKSVKLDPWYEHGYIMLGLAYMQAERWDQAQWAFEDATKVDPDDPHAWLGVGSALNEQKDYAGAQKALQHSLDIKPDSAEAHYELARSLWGMNRLQPAEEHARRATELNKDYASPHVLMGNIYVSEVNTEAALAEFHEALRLEPDGPQAATVKATIAKIEKAMADTAPKKKQ